MLRSKACNMFCDCNGFDARNELVACWLRVCSTSAGDCNSGEAVWPPSILERKRCSR